MLHKLIAALGALALAACATPAGAPPAPATAAATTPGPPASYEATGWLARTLPELSCALIGREITSVELTQAYLDRIAALDRAGPRLQ